MAVPCGVAGEEVTSEISKEEKTSHISCSFKLVNGGDDELCTVCSREN
jgi:hypothetical protein